MTTTKQMAVRGGRGVADNQEGACLFHFYHIYHHNSSLTHIHIVIILFLLLGNMVNIQSVQRKKSGGKAQSIRSGRDHSENVLSRQLSEAARTVRH